jgi:hypothetical protein
MNEPVTSDQQIWIASAGSRGSSTIEFLLRATSHSFRVTIFGRFTFSPFAHSPRQPPLCARPLIVLAIFGTHIPWKTRGPSVRRATYQVVR